MPNVYSAISEGRSADVKRGRWQKAWFLLQVSVNTVDSYQGRQMDAIILSCVRSNPGASGVGFLADMRRMNVSITRAKRALWVLGSAATLRQSPVWASMIENATDRGLLIKHAHARYSLVRPSLETVQ